MNRVLSLIQCPGLGSPYLGQNVGVAVLDTGIYKHPDFENRIAAFHDVVHRKTRFYDDCGHGTHVAGIIAGGGIYDRDYRGVAPKASIISVKVLDHKGNGNINDLLKGLQWVIDNKDLYNIRIVNISAGTAPKGQEEEASALIQGVDHAWDHGLVVVTAAGNNGPKPMSITTPGISRKVITVGCSDDHEMVDVLGSRMVNYSGRGPTPACILKPEIVAPGSGIMACAAPNRKSSRPYCKKSGTSMATPVVSGAIALLLSKYPEMTNIDVKIKLRESTINLGLPKNQQGWGMLDVKRLLH